jgi:hypothetical protein
MSAGRNTIVFIGPTLKRSDAETLANAEFRGPAAMGDMTRAASENAEAIVLIDGLFETGPSVWHKEILWALSRNIPVIGASSMGALRAAELHDHGMTGHGDVFLDFAEGRLHDDDEVAVTHGPVETGWLPLTDAMVDIRAYAASACAAGLLSKQQQDRLVSHAKARHFSQRSFLASANAILNSSTVQIADWFSTGPIGVKENDCRSLLSTLGSCVETARLCLQNTPFFTPTVYLSRLQQFGFNF